MGDIINKLLEETELTKLPSLPHVLIKLLSACQTDTTSIDTLVEIINKDASLSAKVLAVANSPVYAKSRKLTSLKQILLFLGIDTIKSIAITASVQQFFSRYSKEKSRFLKNFWEHTLYTAIVAKSLAKLTSYSNPEEAYLAGLLHDIGKLVFENYSQHEYSELLTNTSSDERLRLEYEKYNITHDLIGARLLEIWNVTDVISEAIKYHHAKTEDIIEAHQLVKIIHLANNMSSDKFLSNKTVVEYSFRLFDLSDSVLMEILKNAKDEVKKIAASLDIDIGDINANMKTDEDTQILLAQKIRDISLTQGSMQLLKEDVEGVDYSVIQKTTIILFGLHKSCLFLYSDEDNVLTLDYTTSIINPGILKGFELKSDSSSLVAKAMNSGKPETYFSDDKELHQPVIDHQIISAFKTEGILCVPLIKDGQNIGVIVIGINRDQYKHLLNKMSLMNMYMSEIASRILSVKSSRQIRNNFINESKKNIKTKTREIIHEVNNPLAIIRNYLKILGQRLSEDDPAQNDLDIISEEIDRVGSIILKCDKDVEQIDTLSITHEINVNELILSINAIMESSLYSTHNVKSELNLFKNIDLIDSNKNLIKQILTNLIKNAVEAMVDKKEITIATRNININGKRFVEIEVSDTGPGIPEEILRNIYKPVTSTKGKSHSGLGLSIVKNLLDNAEGTITCKTGDSGTTFNIHFPSKINDEFRSNIET